MAQHAHSLSRCALRIISLASCCTQHSPLPLTHLTYCKPVDAKPWGAVMPRVMLQAEAPGVYLLELAADGMPLESPSALTAVASAGRVAAQWSPGRDETWRRGWPAESDMPHAAGSAPNAAGSLVAEGRVPRRTNGPRPVVSTVRCGGEWKRRGRNRVVVDGW